MKALLLKLLLLLLFLVLLFLILRVLEGVAWYETGLVVSKLVDPFSLSVRKLKVLLDGRGISYDGMVEKQELTALIEASGDVMEGELLLLEQENQEEAAQSTSFSSGPHFYEEVEDKKDSIWLIQIVPRGHVPLLDQGTWKTVVTKVFHFGIRTGTFDCSKDVRFCRKKGWTQPILMLAMPQGLNQKDNVVMATYPSTNLKAPKVIKWVSTRLANTVHRVDEGRLVKEWLYASQTQPAVPPIRLVLMSVEEEVEAPLFFSAISLKYSGRVRFGQAAIHKSTRNWLSEELKIQSKPSHYLVATPEGVITYGTREGEYLNHRAMDVFLGTLYPQANDFFMPSFVVANMLCVLELIMNQREVLAKRLCLFLWVWVKYNAVLIMMWLPLLALIQIPFLEPVFQFCQKLLRLSSQTALASQLRFLWIMHSHQGSLIIVSFFVFCAAVGYVQSCCRGGDGTEESSSSEWLQSTAVYYYNMLVRPSPGYSPVLMTNAQLEEGMNWDRIINQSMFPNLFLLADVSEEYLHRLPTWRYHQRKMAREWSSDEKCCACWRGCFSDAEKPHRENYQLLREYFKGHDKKFDESKTAKKEGKRSKKHPCRKCFGKMAGNPSKGEPFLVTSSHENSPEEMPSTQPSDCPLTAPENIGSTSIGACDINTGTETLLPNSESIQFDKGNPGHKSHIGNDLDGSDKHNSQDLTCDSRFDVKEAVDPVSHFKTTYDPWPEAMVESLDCSICLEPYVHGIELCGLPCGHAFHQRCILAWLTTNRNHCCPNCRWPAYKIKGSKLCKHKE